MGCPMPGPSPFVLEGCLEVPAAVKNAFDQHGIGRDDKCDGDAVLESYRPQAGQQVVPLLASQWKRLEPGAEGNDAGDVGIGPDLARLLRDVLVQAVNLALGP